MTLIKNLFFCFRLGSWLTEPGKIWAGKNTENLFEFLGKIKKVLKISQVQRNSLLK